MNQTPRARGRVIGKNGLAQDAEELQKTSDRRPELKAYSIFSGSALIGVALLSSSLIFSATTSSAETLSSQSRQQTTKSTQTLGDSETPVALESSSEGNIGEKIAVAEVYVVPPANYVATAYSLRGRTASGRPVAKGLIAADPRHLPLGSRVRLEAGAYSGEYLVADTGGAHKSDRGLVRTGLTSATAVRLAVSGFEEHLGGAAEVLVQPMESGVEVALGVVRDPTMGPLVMVAAGGTATNLWADRVFLLPPISLADARHAVRGLRIWPLLEGYRGGPAADVARSYAFRTSHGQVNCVESRR